MHLSLSKLSIYHRYFILGYRKQDQQTRWIWMALISCLAVRKSCFCSVLVVISASSLAPEEIPWCCPTLIFSGLPAIDEIRSPLTSISSASTMEILGVAFLSSGEQSSTCVHEEDDNDDRSSPCVHEDDNDRSSPLPLVLLLSSEPDDADAIVLLLFALLLCCFVCLNAKNRFPEEFHVVKKILIIKY